MTFENSDDAIRACDEAGVTITNIFKSDDGQWRVLGHHVTVIDKVRSENKLVETGGSMLIALQKFYDSADFDGGLAPKPARKRIVDPLA